MDFTVTDKVKVFDGAAAWHYIRVPTKITSIFLEENQKAMVPIVAQISDANNESTWKTSLLPMGDGTHFIALKKQIRQKHKITVHQTVTVQFSLGY